MSTSKLRDDEIGYLNKTMVHRNSLPAMTKDEVARLIYEGCAREGVGELFEGDTKFEDLPQHIADCYRRVAEPIVAEATSVLPTDPDKRKAWSAMVAEESLKAPTIIGNPRFDPENYGTGTVDVPAPMSGETNEAKP